MSVYVSSKTLLSHSLTG